MVVHIYVIPYIFYNTKYKNYKIINYIEVLSYVLFLAIALCPTFMGVFYMIMYAINNIAWLTIDNLLNLSNFVIVFLFLFNFMLSRSFLVRYIRQKKYKEQNELKIKEITSLEVAKKLSEDGYYSHSYIELLKVIENYLFRKLRLKDLIFKRESLMKMFDIAIKNNIINKQDLETLRALTEMRNSFVHGEHIGVSKGQAQEALAFVESLLYRLGSNN
ncbi:hypothetical protein [Hymenobacter sp. GOD-10R]|uniref:hypothetical protein n=1 Tax=Hymenobacter sp. GOD-10R TaxID=3093922 RepID=UPI002D78F407|nr:hypothetical protein [Hymenobacter sp. GOD-10R]WRQ29156.1 hypothetical protein SD425_02620 [Hymenobacter sp. GOD-10R]